MIGARSDRRDERDRRGLVTGSLDGAPSARRRRARGRRSVEPLRALRGRLGPVAPVRDGRFEIVRRRGRVDGLARRRGDADDGVLRRHVGRHGAVVRGLAAARGLGARGVRCLDSGGGVRSALGLGGDGLGLVLGLADRGLFVATRELATAGEVLVEVVRTDEVLDMEERGALLTDVDEGGLEAGENARDLSQVHVADSAGLAAFSFDVELGDDAVFDQRSARLAEITAQYEDVLGHRRESLSRPR